MTKENIRIGNNPFKDFNMKYDICVIGGAGHVGLPLAIAFAKEKKNVVIYDINPLALKTIEEGKMPFMEQGAQDILKEVIHKSLFTSDKSEVITDSRYVVVVIGTPVDEHLNPKFTDMKRFFEKLLPYLRNDHIIILRSTVYPGISEKVRRILKKELPDIEICFCPERILEGKAMEELYSLPQIVSGFQEKAISEVSDLFRLLTKDIILVSPIEAELSKLFTNSWRYIQFAIANQFYMIAEEYNVDYYNIYHAMTSNYPRTKGFPRPGFAAGPCLFKDTMQISAYSNNKFFLGHSAMLINEGLPNFIVGKLKNIFPDLQEKSVGILGMAFKAENDDIRESLSFKLRKILEVEAKEVFCSDVYVSHPQFVTEDELINQSDIVIIGAPHNKYKKLDYKKKFVFDIWNLIGKGIKTSVLEKK